MGCDIMGSNNKKIEQNRNHNNNSKKNYSKNSYKNNKYHKSNDNKRDGNNTKSQYSRENRHQNLYPDDYSITKQQIFNFDDMTFSDELDTSFVENKKKKKEKIIKDLNKSYEHDKIRRESIEKRRKPKLRVFRFIIFLFVVILLLGILAFCIYLLTRPVEPKVVTKEKEVVIVDDNYLFLGDSITEFYDLDVYYPDMPVVNSGVQGNVTEDILDDMGKRVYQYNPSKIFLLIGTNDIDQKLSIDDIVSHIKEIIEEIQKNRPYAEIYLESIYPVDEERPAASNRTNEEIVEINQELEKYCKDENITYIDLFSLLVDSESSEVKIKNEYTKDGLHISDEGYEVITEEIMKYIERK